MTHILDVLLPERFPASYMGLISLCHNFEGAFCKRSFSFLLLLVSIQQKYDSESLGSTVDVTWSASSWCWNERGYVLLKRSG